jgi:hypothetical protein
MEKVVHLFEPFTSIFYLKKNPAREGLFEAGRGRSQDDTCAFTEREFIPAPAT